MTARNNPLFLLLLTVFLGVTLHPVSSWAQASVDYPIAKLRSLDKITARTVTFEANVGSTLKFGSVYIKVRACRKAPEMETPEAASFIQVWEVPAGQKAEQEKAEWIFSGWLFSSSPGLSSLDHPIYDVWVLDCLQSKEGNTPDDPSQGDESRADEGEVSEDAAPDQPAITTP